MEPNSEVKNLYQREDDLGVFLKYELEPEVLIKTEVIDEDIGPTDENETDFTNQPTGI